MMPAFWGRAVLPSKTNWGSTACLEGISRGQRSWGAQPPLVDSQLPGEELGGVARDVERGNTGAVRPSGVIGRDTPALRGETQNTQQRRDGDTVAILQDGGRQIVVLQDSGAPGAALSR
ncbi:hypothetical protein [Streptomyces antimycoticus]|uniref:hypothetical protein n=2 Tax=Streptomyces antimycoticus TaxID=68175 RepID=UPI003830EEC7